MGKIIRKGLAEPDDPIFSTGPEISSNHASKKSLRTSAPGTTGETQVKSGSVSMTEARAAMLDRGNFETSETFENAKRAWEERYSE